MERKPYCSRCKAIDVPLVKYSKTYWKGKPYQYYQCRPCNNARRKKWGQTPEGKESTLRIHYKTVAKYPDKQKARQDVYRAVKNGIISKPMKCEFCKVTGRLEGHHLNYEKPLEVIWLCTGCHTGYHRIELNRTL